MRSLKTIFLIAGIVCINFSAFTQTTKTSTNDELSQIIVGKYDKELSLTSRQKEMLLKETKKYIKAMEQVEKQTAKNNDEKLAQKKQAADEYQFSLDSILTPTQHQQLQLKIKEREDTK